MDPYKLLYQQKGSSSQTETKTYSNLKVSVCDLKNKIVGIEEQLDNVSKHCRDLSSRKNSLRQNLDDANSYSNLNSNETKILYKATQSKYRKSDDSDNTFKNNYAIEKNTTVIEETAQNQKPRAKKKQRQEDSNREQLYEMYSNKNQPMASRFDNNSQALRKTDAAQDTAVCSSHRKKRHHQNDNFNSKTINYETYQHFDKSIPIKTDRKHKKERKHRHEYEEVDKEFISDIIKNQYKPVKLFGRRESENSKFSAPICRDKEFSIRDKVQYGTDLCSCCFEQCKTHDYKNIRSSDISDMGSVCDARLYSSKKYNRYGCDKNITDYNNSDYYDVFPVKEKSSPKSRRKFVEDNLGYHIYKEVPPSPRTQRPRLNLKARAYDDYDEIRNIKQHQPTQSKFKDNIYVHQNEEKETIQISTQKPHHSRYDNRSLSNLDETLKTQITDNSTDKTEKTLSEIKDLLQNFLTIIKKDSVHNENTNATNKREENHFSEFRNNSKLEYAKEHNTQSSSNYKMGPCNGPPFVPMFPNTCCYPVVPICPVVNCVQSPYLFPSSSHTCNVCPKPCSSPRKSKSTSNQNQDARNCNTETQELIKEIYNFVSQRPKSESKKGKYSECCAGSIRDWKNKCDEKSLTTRSAGSRLKASKHDACFGTPSFRCASKSCEAIVSGTRPAAYPSMASYSDTILERLSVEATQSSTESELSNYRSVKEKRNKLQRMLRSCKLWGRKKKDIIEELNESQSTIEVDIEHKAPPFRQHITNYAMYDQEFYNTSLPTPQHNYKPPFNHKDRGHKPTEPRTSPTSFDQNDFNYNRMPQVPLCFKEIEVKSTATQSERKMSLFSKLTQKAKQKQYAAEHSYPTYPAKSKGLFNWKTLQEQAKQRPDSMNFTLKTQKQLEQGDVNIRNAMIKKLFYKRNPFSPRNIIVRTLLGKDQSSFGNPPKFYKPRMFI